MRGNKWASLQLSLKNVFSQISEVSNRHLVSVINFSSKAIIEIKNSEANSVDTERLTFFGGGTNFSSAFEEAFTILTKDDSNSYPILIFMTDGEGNYPNVEINKIEKLIKSSKFNDRKFQFYGLEFEAQSDIVKTIVEKLEGELKFAVGEEDLKMRYVEIITKSLE